MDRMHSLNRTFRGTWNLGVLLPPRFLSLFSAESHQFISGHDSRIAIARNQHTNLVNITFHITASFRFKFRSRITNVEMPFKFNTRFTNRKAMARTQRPVLPHLIVMAVAGTVAFVIFRSGPRIPPGPASHSALEEAVKVMAEDMIILGMVQEYRVINTMGVMALWGGSMVGFMVMVSYGNWDYR
ncbi:hypothetical protein FPQ18DRAFT_306522 [Pyronema domesticum]|nr:hypothetical protein FPQ18DRAFT_306522 [Pyronema domesticum]